MKDWAPSSDLKCANHIYLLTQIYATYLWGRNRTEILGSIVAGMLSQWQNGHFWIHILYTWLGLPCQPSPKWVSETVLGSESSQWNTDHITGRAQIGLKISLTPFACRLVWHGFLFLLDLKNWPRLPGWPNRTWVPGNIMGRNGSQHDTDHISRRVLSIKMWDWNHIANMSKDI